MRAINPGIWLRSRFNVAEAMPQRSIEPRLSLVPEQKSRAARRRIADSLLLIGTILCLCVFAATFLTYVLDPAVSTLAGSSAEAWTQSSP
jgi:hypothetical protein